MCVVLSKKTYSRGWLYGVYSYRITEYVYTLHATGTYIDTDRYMYITDTFIKYRDTFRDYMCRASTCYTDIAI